MGWAGRVSGAETHPMAAVARVVMGGSRRPQRARPVISGGGVCVACSSPQATEAAVRLVGLLSTTPGREPPGPALACC